MEKLGKWGKKEKEKSHAKSERRKGREWEEFKPQSSGRNAERGKKKRRE
jgi:hypothetical protein